MTRQRLLLQKLPLLTQLFYWLFKSGWLSPRSMLNAAASVFPPQPATAAAEHQLALSEHSRQQQPPPLEEFHPTSPPPPPPSFRTHFSKSALALASFAASYASIVEDNESALEGNSHRLKMGRRCHRRRQQTAGNRRCPVTWCVTPLNSSHLGVHDSVDRTHSFRCMICGFEVSSSLN